MGIFDAVGEFIFGENPGKAASKRLEQVPGVVKPYYEPMIQQGKGAYDVLNPTTSQMTTDPAAYLEHLMEMYEPSKGYNLKKEEALRAAHSAGAAGGYAGTYSDARDQARLTSGLMGEDMQQWLQNVLGIQQTGMGQQQNFYNTGSAAADTLASTLANNLGSQASMDFMGQQQANMNRQAMFKMIAQGLGAGYGNFGGGGGMPSVSEGIPTFTR